jgi:putative transcriptional regulator
VHTRPHAAAVSTGYGMPRRSKGSLTCASCKASFTCVRNHVREQRVQREMSQAELGMALGVSRQTVISIENGRYLPSLPLAFKIARFFGMTVDKMFDPEDEADVEVH